MKAAENVIKTITSAVNAWNRRSVAPTSHGNADMYLYGKDYTGRVLERPLPWIAIEVAKKFVEKKQALPTKGDLIQELTCRFQKLKNKKPNFWTALFKSAGLSTLKARKPWSVKKPPGALNKQAEVE